MAKEEKTQIDQETKNANQQINEKFYGKEDVKNKEHTDSPDESVQANIKINKEIDSNEQLKDSSPTSYLYNNMAAIDVGKKGDRDK